MAQENICVNCGLCCDGTLFDFANITDVETIDPSFSFKVFESDDGKRKFKLGCCYLENKTCTIYDKRPYSVCSTFKCFQLKSFLSNIISYDDAMEIINSTLVLKENIEKRLSNEFPSIQHNSLFKKMQTFEAYYLNHPEPIIFRKAHSQLLLDLARFKQITEKYFYKSKFGL